MPSQAIIKARLGLAKISKKFSTYDFLLLHLVAAESLGRVQKASQGGKKL